MDTRQKELIQLILTEEPVPSSYLAQTLHISERTILNEIKTLNQKLAPFQIVIDNKFGKGYFIKGFDSEIFEAFRSEFIYYYYYSPDVQQLPERTALILRKILLHSEGIKSSYILESLEISESTLHSELKAIREILGKYQLTLSFKPYRGMFVEGNEGTIRQCIVDHCDIYNPYNTNESVVFQNSFIHFDIQLSQWKETFFQLKKYFLENQVMINQITLNRIATHLEVMLFRIQQGHLFSISEVEEEKIKDTPIFKIMQNFFSTYVSENIPVQEQIYLTIIIISNIDFYTDNDLSLVGSYIYIGEELKNYVNQKLLTKMNINLEDINAQKRMDGIFVQYYFRSKYEIHENNIYKTSSSNITNAPASSYIAYQILKILNEHTLKQMDYYLLTLFTSYFYNGVMKIPSQPKKMNMILINSYGRINNDTLKYKIFSILGHYVKDVSFYYVHELDNLSLTDYDCILTSYPPEIIRTETNIDIPIPVIYLNDINSSIANLQETLVLPNILKDIIHEHNSGITRIPLPKKQSLKSHLAYIYDKCNFYTISKNTFIEDGLHQLKTNNAIAESCTATIFFFSYQNDEKKFLIFDLPKPIKLNKKQISHIIVFSTNLQNRIFSIKNIDSIFRRIHLGKIDVHDYN